MLSAYSGKAARILLAIGIPFLFVVIVWRVSGIHFETNDDAMITKILAGAYAGKPDPHAVFTNYLLSYPLYLLYSMSAGVAWYGGMLALCHVLMYAALLHSVWSNAGSVMEYLFFGGTVGGFALLNFHLLAVIQFTSTAALLAVAGYCCLYWNRSFRQGLLFFFGLEWLAFCIRSDAMLMIQPYGAAMGLVLYLLLEGGSVQARCKKAALMLLAALAVLGSGWIGSLIGYRSEAWRGYSRFHKARAELVDYYGMLNYEEVQPILDKYDVTQAEYESFWNNIVLDQDVSAECLEEIIVYAGSRQRNPPNLVKLLGQVWLPGSLGYHMRIENVAVLAWGLVLSWLILRRRWCLSAALGMVAAGKTFVLGYLYFRGRTPFRVTAPLLACETLLLVSLIVWDFVHNKAEKQKPCFFCLICAIFAASCLYAANMQRQKASYENAMQKIYQPGLAEIQEYCRSHPQNRYLLDAFSFSYYRGSVFETKIYWGGQNYVESGSWFSNSPVSQRRLGEYLQPYENGFYYIVLEGVGRDFANALFAEKAGLQPELKDKIAASHGGTYLVWYFGK